MRFLLAFFLAVFCSLPSVLAQPASDSLTNNIATTKVYRKGLYRNLYEFQTNSPSVINMALILDKRPDKEIYNNGGGRYRLYNANEKGEMVSLLKGNYWGYSDGDSLYLNISGKGEYVDLEKLETVGLYCYFVNHREDNAGVVAAGAVFGIMGAVIATVAADNENLAKQGHVLHLNTGKTYVLGQTMATRILNSDPELKARIGPVYRYKGHPKDFITEYNSRNQHLVGPFKR